jgi:hypothetical protein
MMKVLQWLHWHGQHMLKADPNFSFAHPSYLLSKILFLLELLNLFVGKQYLNLLIIYMVPWCDKTNQII